MPEHPFQLHKKVRKCNTCGRETNARYNTCRKWDKTQKRQVYCGFMRVIR